MTIMVCVINCDSHDTYTIIPRSLSSLRNYYYYLDFSLKSITFLHKTILAAIISSMQYPGCFKIFFLPGQAY